MEFKEDSSFEDRFRSHLKDYRGSGYDRGHMVSNRSNLVPGIRKPADSISLEIVLLLLLGPQTFHICMHFEDISYMQ